MGISRESLRHAANPLQKLDHICKLVFERHLQHVIGFIQIIDHIRKLRAVVVVIIT